MPAKHGEKKKWIHPVSVSGEYLDVGYQESKALSMTVTHQGFSMGATNGGTILLCPVFFCRAFLHLWLPCSIFLCSGDR